MKWLFAPVFLFCLNSAGQSLRKFTITLTPDDATEKPMLPFAAVKILDARFDQSNVGCIALDARFHSITQYKELAVFPDSLKHYLPVFLEQVLSFDQQSSDTLVMLVKQFRITDYLYNGINQQVEPLSLLKLSASFFVLRKEKYFRLFSIDDILEQHWRETAKGLSKKQMPPLRSEALVKILTRIFRDRSWKESGAFFSRDEVMKGLHQRFKFPVLEDTLISTGLYRTFSDFTNNRPSVTNIKLINTKDRIRVEDASGKPVALENYWGLSDGKHHYIVFRNRLSMLDRIDHSYRFAGYRNSRDLKKGPGYGDMATSYGILPAIIFRAADEKEAMEFFYLNMDTGEVYLEEIFGKSGLKSLQKDILN